MSVSSVAKYFLFCLLVGHRCPRVIRCRRPKVSLLLHRLQHLRRRQIHHPGRQEYQKIELASFLTWHWCLPEYHLLKAAFVSAIELPGEASDRMTLWNCQVIRFRLHFRLKGKKCFTENNYSKTYSTVLHFNLQQNIHTRKFVDVLHIVLVAEIFQCVFFILVFIWSLAKFENV